MALQDTDKFVVQRGSSYLTVKYDTLSESISPDLAIQSTDGVRGTPGIMFPGTTLRYENGELNVDFPTSLRFIDIITEDFQKPRDLVYRTGDFYLVSINEDDTVQLDAADWPGIDGKEYTSVDLTGTNGTLYQADTGAYLSMNAPGDTGTIYENQTSDIASGIILDVVIKYGRIYADSVVIKDGGENYAVDDIFTLQTSYSGGAPATFIVYEVSDDGRGEVTRLGIVDSGSDNPQGAEYGGFGFLLTKESSGTLSRLDTFARTGNGSGLVVDAEVLNGEISSVSISPFSSHNNYKSGDIVYVADQFGSQGDALIEVTVATDSSDYIIGYNGDKIIYREADVIDNISASWLLVESGKSDISILGVEALPKSIVPSSTGEEYFNPEKAITVGFDANTRYSQIAIRNASAKYQASGNIDRDKSYSGLFHPEEKTKLEEIEEYATRGSLNSIVTDPRRDLYSGRNYYTIDLKNTNTDSGVEVEINVITASYGLQGVVSVVTSQVVANTILDKASVANEGVMNEEVSATMNAGQIAEYFAPKNFYALRKLY